MKKHLKIIACHFRMNLASALEYRASFLSQAFGMALSNSAFIFFWWIAFGQLGGRIAGYSFEDVMFIWAAASASFGLSYILFANVGHLSRMIVSGELDTFLLQPCNVLVNVLCARTSLTAYGDLAYGIILMALTHGGDAAAWGWFAVSLGIGALLLCAINLFAHTLTFYVGDASTIATMVREFTTNFSLYPETIYGPVVRGIMYTLLPAGFIVHIPLRLARGGSPWLAAALFGATAAYCAFSVWFFYRGLRRYESGNAIVTKL